MTKQKDEETTEKKEPVSSLSSSEGKQKEQKQPATDVPRAAQVLREPDREKNRLTEVLLILIILLLGATSVYFYQANERLTEKYNTLSKGLETNSGTLSSLENDFSAFKSEKDSTAETLEQIKLDVKGLMQTNDTIKERLYNLSEGQRGNIMEINRIVTRISSSEKEEAINELKKALLIVNSINKKDSTAQSRAIGEKLESDITNLIQQIAEDGRPSVTLKQEAKPEAKQVEATAPTKKEEASVTTDEAVKTGFGKIELQEEATSKEEVVSPKPETPEQKQPAEEKTQTENQ